MKDDFDQYRKDWEVAPESIPHFQEVHKEIARLRKRRKNRIILWYSAVIAFCMAIISYVIYTDELNSVYKSISEFLLLFASVQAFRTSWKNITQQKQEYLLNNVEFIQSIARQGSRSKLTHNLAFISILSVALFLYFVESLLTDTVCLGIALAVLVTFNLLIWLLIKPHYSKQNVAKNKKLLKLLHTNEKRT